MRAVRTQSLPFDVVVFGSTGFTGYLTARYLAQKQPQRGAGRAFTFAIAGRSESKLQEVQQRLQADVPGMERPSVIVADSSSPESLRAMTQQCHVVVTTVGPYLKYGRELVAACVATQSDYVRALCVRSFYMH
jgi:short subunit dehydrogenase-like uncharacterized protein